jgi:hypothetical protein
MELIFWLIFGYLVAWAISIFMATKLENWYGVAGCLIILVGLIYIFISRILAIMMITGSFGFVVGYTRFKSRKMGFMLCGLFLVLTIIPFIAMWLFIKKGESVETSIIVSNKLDNMFLASSVEE